MDHLMNFKIIADSDVWSANVWSTEIQNKVFLCYSKDLYYTDWTLHWRLRENAKQQAADSVNVHKTFFSHPILMDNVSCWRAKFLLLHDVTLFCLPLIKYIKLGVKEGKSGFLW